MADNIQHIVVLMLENRSFDQMAGCLHTANPAIDGIDPAHPQQNNFQMPGTPPPPPIPFTQRAGSDDTKLGGNDPKHDLGDVLGQMSGNNSGFVNSFGHAYPTASSDALQQIMNFFPLGQPALVAYAGEEFPGVRSLVLVVARSDLAQPPVCAQRHFQGPRGHDPAAGAVPRL